MKNGFLKRSKYVKKISIDKIICRTFFASNTSRQKEIITETVNTAHTIINEKKSKKKKIFGLLFFIFNVALVVGVFYNFAREQGGIRPLSTLISSHPRWRFLVVAIILFIMVVIFNSLKTFFLIHNRTGKWRPILSFKMSTISKYYDLMTPFNSGGKPFEIYYLKKNGHSGDISTAIPLAKYMVWQFVFMLVCISILIFYPHENISSKLVFVGAWIGLCVILAVFLFILFMSVAKKFGNKMLSMFLLLLHKLHIIKNYPKALRKALKFVKQYQYSIRAFTKQPFALITAGFCTLGAIICNSLIAYFIYRAFIEVPTVMWYDMFSKCIICELAICFIPLPGGAGVSELSFNSLLGTLFTAGTLFWGVLIWRILTYYLHIALGGILLLFDVLIPKRRKKSSISPPLSTNL